jgi:hypothetical protein
MVRKSQTLVQVYFSDVRRFGPSVFLLALLNLMVWQWPVLKSSMLMLI